MSDENQKEEEVLAENPNEGVAMAPVSEDPISDTNPDMEKSEET